MMMLIISSIFAYGIQATSQIECSPLEGGDYVECNANCYPGNPLCYYGPDAPAPGQICYCWTDKPINNVVVGTPVTQKPYEYKPVSETQEQFPECTTMSIKDITADECTAKCYNGWVKTYDSACYYGSDAPAPSQICGCFYEPPRSMPQPDHKKPLPPIKPHIKNQCSPLNTKITWEQCNKICSLDNPDCYYGNEAAAPGQICYCWTDKPITHKKQNKPSENLNFKDIECTSLSISKISYEECNEYCSPINPICYYGNEAAAPDQICYCYTEVKPVPTTYTTTNKPAKDIECSPLSTKINWKQCNNMCYVGNPLCYYGPDAAAPDQMCYCWTDKPITAAETIEGNELSEPYSDEKDIECTSLSISTISYEECNEYCSLDNPDCYYGNEAAAPGQICYCYTEVKPVPTTYTTTSKPAKDIECSPLNTKINWKQCNNMCYVGNPDCYYGPDAAAPGQMCYCWTDKPVNKRRLGSKSGSKSASAETVETTAEPSKEATKKAEPSNDIECTPLTEAADYESCNEDCFIGNPDCYYGNATAESGEICYCYTDEPLRRRRLLYYQM